MCYCHGFTHNEDKLTTILIKFVWGEDFLKAKNDNPGKKIKSLYSLNYSINVYLFSK